MVILDNIQGSFDNKSDTHDCAAVFAYSALLSSVQVFNIKSNLDASMLTFLDLFTWYGRRTVSEVVKYQVLFDHYAVKMSMHFK